MQLWWVSEKVIWLLHLPEEQLQVLTHPSPLFPQIKSCLYLHRLAAQQQAPKTVLSVCHTCIYICIVMRQVFNPAMSLKFLLLTLAG